MRQVIANPQTITQQPILDSGKIQVNLSRVNNCVQKLVLIFYMLKRQLAVDKKVENNSHGPYVRFCVYLF